MIKKIPELSISFLILLIFLGCEKNEIHTPPYPRVQTLTVAPITDEGVTFQSKITFMSDLPVKTYGYEWGVKNNDYVYYTNKVELNYSNTSGSLNYEVSYGLYPDKLYAVRAFVTNEKYKVYGLEIPFKSLGAKGPVLLNITPKQGTWGDTIKITGKYFTKIRDDINVKFGEFSSRIISNNDSIIVCLVPENIPGKTVPLTVTATGKFTQSAENFSLLSPSIESINPSQGSFDDIITLYGTYFNPAIQKNIVKFNNVPAEVTEVSRTSIKVKVPRTLKDTVSAITVSVNLQLSNTDKLFKLAPPVITSISPDLALTGGTIQINGNFFHPVATENTVYFGSLQGVIKSSTKNTITAEIPRGISNRSVPIYIRAGNYVAISPEKLTLKDPWIRKADVPHQYERFSATAFSLNGKGYVGMGYGYRGSNFWKYDPKIDSWAEISPYPGIDRDSPASFTIGGKAYVGLGGTNLPEFWSYDPDINKWSRIADFPAPNSSAIGFAVNGKAYVITRTNSSNFWEYDPISDTWTKRKDFPVTGYYAFTPDAGFIINDKIYVYAADGTTADNKLWYYDISTDSWILNSTVPGSDLDIFTTGFSLNGYGYIVGYYYLFKFDPISNTWTKLYDKKVPGSQRYRSVAFVINNLAYFGTSYYSGAPTAWDLWEFDPNY